MIKVTRTNVDVKVEYISDYNQSEGVATAFCKSVDDAKALVSTIKQAIKLDYGFAKCRAILEGDTLFSHGGKRPGSGRPATDRSPITRQVTELEKQAVDNLLKNLRKVSPMDLKTILDLYDQGNATLLDIGLALADGAGIGNSEQLQRAMEIIDRDCKNR